MCSHLMATAFPAAQYHCKFSIERCSDNTVRALLRLFTAGMAGEADDGINSHAGIHGRTFNDWGVGPFFIRHAASRARVDNMMPSADHVEWSGPLRVARPRDAVHVPRLRS